MSIITPVIYTPIHQEEVNYLSSVTEETIRKIIQNCNFLLDLSPIGTIIFVNTNQYGVTQPNLNIWQLCDGSEITNLNSPIRTIGLVKRYTPDLRNLYLTGANNENLNPVTGTQNHNLSHGHTTSHQSLLGSFVDSKGQGAAAPFHAHSLPAQYSNPTIIDAPAYIYYNAYMKIC